MGIDINFIGRITIETDIEDMLTDKYHPNVRVKTELDPEYDSNIYDLVCMWRINDNFPQFDQESIERVPMYCYAH